MFSPLPLLYIRNTNYTNQKYHVPRNSPLIEVFICFDFVNNLSRLRSLPSYYTLHSSFDGIVASNLTKFTHIFKCFGNLIAFHIVVTFNHASFLKLNICLYTKQKEPCIITNSTTNNSIVTYIESQSTQGYALICNNQHRYNDERNLPSKATQAHQEQVVQWKVQE